MVAEQTLAPPTLGKKYAVTFTTPDAVGQAVSISWHKKKGDEKKKIFEIQLNHSGKNGIYMVDDGSYCFDPEKVTDLSKCVAHAELKPGVKVKIEVDFDKLQVYFDDKVAEKLKVSSYMLPQADEIQIKSADVRIKGEVVDLGLSYQAAIIVSVVVIIAVVLLFVCVYAYRKLKRRYPSNKMFFI